MLVKLGDFRTLKLRADSVSVLNVARDSRAVELDVVMPESLLPSAYSLDDGSGRRGSGTGEVAGRRRGCSSARAADGAGAA